jgi:hypothetical protein
MTTTHEEARAGAITKMLEEQVKIFETKERTYVRAIDQILPQVKALEEAQQKKAKEERNRNITTLTKMIEETEELIQEESIKEERDTDLIDKLNFAILAFNSAIVRINNQP